MIEWSAELELGHEAIDGHHRKMVEAANNVYRQFTGGTHDARLDALLELRNLTAAHFAHEERLMTEHAYPNVLAHTENHCGLMAELERLIGLMRANQQAAAEKLLQFLRGLVVSHILHFDRDVVEHIKR